MGALTDAIANGPQACALEVRWVFHRLGPWTTSEGWDAARHADLIEAGLESGY